VISVFDRSSSTASTSPYDHAHNARIDDDLYGQRSMAETVNSSVKRSLGVALRARSWYREFREVTLMCTVYNIKEGCKTADSTPFIRLNTANYSHGIISAVTQQIDR